MVSILIPAFNAERWISETIKSALGQTWARKEVIVVDDGSTDRTFYVAQRFGSTQVKVVTQEKQGAAAARNRALSLSQGKYIQWLDADDLLAQDKIQKQIATANGAANPRTLFSSSWGHFVYRSSKARFCPSALWCDLSPIEWLRRKLEEDLFMQPASWLVSRELTQAAGPWDTRLTLDDDGEYFCRVVRASDCVRFVPDAKVFYRRSGPSSLSQVGVCDRKMNSQFLSMELQIACIRSLEESERIRAACLSFLQSYQIIFYPERPDIVKRAVELAKSLGGDLCVPQLPLRYHLIQKLFGWTAAKLLRLWWNRWKNAFEGLWDKAMLWFELRTSGELFK